MQNSADLNVSATSESFYDCDDEQDLIEAEIELTKEFEKFGKGMKRKNVERNFRA